MKVYFTGSVHNKGVDLETYKKIVSVLENNGHQVQAGHILSVPLYEIEDKSKILRKKYHKKLTKWIAGADVIICEVSYPSTINIGHEITLALDKGKPILALHKPGREATTLLGIDSEKFTLLEYTEETLADVLSDWLEEVEGVLNTRFTMILEPRIKKYLDKITKTGLSRSEYIRNLILQDMEKNRK